MSALATRWASEEQIPEPSTGSVLPTSTATSTASPPSAAPTLQSPVGQNHASIIAQVVAPQPRTLMSLMDIAGGPPDPRATVLGDRYLCIGGSMLFIGPSGIGKSSASVQQDVLWSLGRPAFGIRPARPLKILTIQAENDDEDLAEMRDGVINGLGLTEEDRQAVRERVFYKTESRLTGKPFLDHVDALLGLSNFDLLRIDPLLAFLGADVNSVAETATFLRNGLNPILVRRGVACIVNHHTPKVTNRDTSGWRGSDWMYAGAGSADITNWARAIMIIDPTHVSHVFRFIAAKRGNRIGWVDEGGQRELARYYCHAQAGLYWRYATPEDLSAAEMAAAAVRKGFKAVKTAADLIALVPESGAVPKNELLETAMQRGFTKHRAAAVLKCLIDEGQLFEWKIRRSGTNPQVQISRMEQSRGEVSK